MVPSLYEIANSSSLKVDYVLHKTTRITMIFVALSPDLFVENFQIAGMNYQKYNNPLKVNVSIY